MLALVTALTLGNSVGIVMARFFPIASESQLRERHFQRSGAQFLNEGGQLFECLRSAWYQSLLGRTSQLRIDDTAGKSVARKSCLRCVIKNCLCRSNTPEEFINARQHLRL